MSTRAIFLPESASFPNTNFPALLQDAQFRNYLGFDTTTSETCYWTFVAPQGLTGALTLVVTYRAASATSGTFQFDGSLEAITSADALNTATTSSFDTVNTSAADTVPATAGYVKQVSLTLTNADAISVADIVRLKLSRNIADTAAGDIQVLAVELRDAA